MAAFARWLRLLQFWFFPCLPNFACADKNLAEVHLIKMVETPKMGQNQSQHSLDRQADDTPCSEELKSVPVHNGWFGVDVNAVAGLKEPLRLPGRFILGNFRLLPQRREDDLGNRSETLKADVTRKFSKAEIDQLLGWWSEGVNGHS